MKLSNVALALSGIVFGGMLLSSHASAAEGRLVVYCSAQTRCVSKKPWLLRKNMVSKPVLSVVAQAQF